MDLASLFFLLALDIDSTTTTRLMKLKLRRFLRETTCLNHISRMPQVCPAMYPLNILGLFLASCTYCKVFSIAYFLWDIASHELIPSLH